MKDALNLAQINRRVGVAAFLFLVLCCSYPTRAAPGDHLWSPIATGGNIGSSVAIDGAAGNLYVGSADRSVQAYDSLGNPLWRFATGGMVGSTPTISADNSTLYVGAHDGILYAIDTANGTALWRFSTGGVIFSSPALSLDGTVYVGSADGNLYAIDPATGIERWHYAIGSDVASSPAIGTDGTVYVGARDGFIYALDPAPNPATRVIWSHQLAITEGAFSPSIGADGTIYVGAFNNTLYALDPAVAALNREKWSLVLGGRIASAPAIGPDGLLYVTTYDDGMLHAVDTSLPAVAWDYPVGGTVYSSPAIAADGTVYVASSGVANELYALDPSNPAQRVRWSAALDNTVVASPTIGTTGNVYISSTDSLYAIEDSSGGLASSDWPIFGLDTRHSASLELPDGDVNGDGQVDATDVLLADQHVLGTRVLTAEQIARGDLYAGDGQITTSDYLLIIQASLDDDGDGLSNYAELNYGGDPQVYTAGVDTNPDAWDTDGDGISDGEELNVGTDPLEPASNPSPIYAIDMDGDGVEDNSDNCILVPNPDQIDVNNDGYGNACDADLTNDGLVNTLDSTTFINYFNSQNLEADFNRDGLVNTLDNIMFVNMFNQPPGPSGVAQGSDIQILTPANEEIIDDNTVNVYGIFPGTTNSGVMVNGKTACTYNNFFYVNNLPIMPGTNTLTATYTAESGSTQDTAVTLTRSGSAQYRFAADQNCGVAPLTVNFNFDTGSNTIQQLDIDFDADGVIDLTTTEPTSALLQHSYTKPGVYPAAVWVTGGGVIEQLGLNIVVNDEAQLDDTLQAVWNGMWAALKAGDKTTAMQYLTQDAGRAYGGIFDSLMPHMTNIYGELSLIERVGMNNNTADYAIIRLENGLIKTFFIHYVKENDGIWRIDSM